MKKVKAIIVDDEPLGRELIKEYLAHQSEIEIVAECRDAHEAYEAITRYQPDLLFLDIQLPEINGFELLEMLDEIPQIIFSTAYDQYAIKAFEVNAVDYLLKPYDEDRFKIAVERALKHIQLQEYTRATVEKLLQTVHDSQKYLQRLLIKQSGKIVILSCHEIHWVEAMDDYVEIHTNKESYLIQQSMNLLETRLNPDQFIRVHRSYIVNIDAIKEIISYSPGRYRLLLKNGKEISLSRSGAKRLKRFCV
ncbi:MAG: LytTR family DNA-binding domain-containing protein [candidate division KSB1 bacterium]|nr:LytTR family DNA-binding domain-containing protein [candidate division KSB1 bacterium]